MSFDGYACLPTDYKPPPYQSKYHPGSQKDLHALPEILLRKLASSLDATSQNKVEYWRLFIDCLPSLSYSAREVETIAKESLEDRSPSLRLLLDVQRRQLIPNLSRLVEIVRSIGCERGYNLFLSKTPVTISQHPVGRTYKAGQVVQLRCEAHCQPGNPLYQWFSWRDNAPFPLVGAVTSTLCFDSIGVEHTGKYCCRATNPYMEKDEEGFEVFSKWANILVVGLPVIKQQPNPRQEVHINRELVLTCRAECYPNDPTYQWYKDDAGPLTGYTNPVLKYRIHTFRDKGIYYCVASNPRLTDGSKKSDACLVDVRPPLSGHSDGVEATQQGGDVPDGFRGAADEQLQHPVPESRPDPQTGGGRAVVGTRGEQVLGTQEERVQRSVSSTLEPLNFGSPEPASSKARTPSGTPEERVQRSVSSTLEPLNFGSPEPASSKARTPSDIPSAPVSTNAHIHFSEQPSNIEVLPNKPIPVSCKAVSHSNTPVEYQVFVRKKDCNKEEHLTPKVSSAELVIESGLKTPAGLFHTYTLFVRVFAEEKRGGEPEHKDSKDFEVKVCKVMFAAKTLERVRAVIGQPLMFMCRPKAYRPELKCSYKWSMKSRPSQELANNTSNVLFLKDVSPDDRGVYDCKVQVTEPVADNLFCSVEVVTVGPKEREPEIHILEHPHSCSAELGEDIKLFACAMADTGEKLTFQWFRGGHKLGIEPELEIQNVSRLDEGEYVCEVSTVTALIKKKTKSAVLNVKVPPPSQISSSAKAEAYVQGKLRAKVALLIANQDYTHVTPLKTAKEEIQRIGEQLRHLGFKVVTLVNLSLTEMQDAENIFCKHLTASEAVGTLSLVYFAGHGFTDGNKEYLMPVDAMEANYKTNLSREDFCAKLRERPKLGKLIRISDCCRTFKKNEEKSHHERAREEFYNFIDITGCAYSKVAYEEGLANVVITVLEKGHLTIDNFIDGIRKAFSSTSEQRPMFSGTISEQKDMRFDDKVDETAYKHFFTLNKDDDKWKENWGLLDPCSLPKGEVLPLKNPQLKERVIVKLAVEEVFSNVIEIRVVADNGSSDAGAVQVCIDRTVLAEQKLKVSPSEPIGGSSDVITIENLQCLKKPMTLQISIREGELKDVLVLTGCKYLFSGLTTSYA